MKISLPDPTVKITRLDWQRFSRFCFVGDSAAAAYISRIYEAVNLLRDYRHELLYAVFPNNISKVRNIYHPLCLIGYGPLPVYVDECNQLFRRGVELSAQQVNYAIQSWSEILDNDVLRVMRQSNPIKGQARMALR